MLEAVLANQNPVSDICCLYATMGLTVAQVVVQCVHVSEQMHKYVCKQEIADL